MTPADLNVVLVAGTAVLLIGVAAVRLSTRAGLPSLLLYLAIGLAIGEAGFGLEFTDANLTQVLSSVALALILAEGGLTTRWSVVRPVLGLAGVLATVGVAVSVTITGLLAWLLLDVDARTAVLLGAVVSSTDAAAVFAVMRTLPLRPRTRATLEAESGFNDPPVIILVTLVTSDLWHDLSVGTAILGFGQQMVVGFAVGAGVAVLGREVLSRTALPAAGLYPLATMAFALLGYGLAGMAGGSPFLAVYVAALVLGNSDLPHRQSTLGFAEGTGWLAQIGLFVLLGLLASPARLLDAVVPALVVGLALTLVARPVSVLLCATPFRVGAREQLFMSWAGLRGAVPIMLATMPITAGLANGRQIFDVVFLLVVVFTLVQGPTLRRAADRLGVVEAGRTRELTIEHAPFEELGATMMTLDVPPGSRLAGVEVSELRLPGDSLVTLVVRGERIFVPKASTVIRTGDQLLLATTDKERAATEKRLRAISREGRLAGWYGEEGLDNSGRRPRPVPSEPPRPAPRPEPVRASKEEPVEATAGQG
jgi:cell volume regulation protein A